MKTCNNCGISKPLTDFYTNGWNVNANTKTRKYKPNCKKCDYILGRGIANKTIEKFFGGFICSRCGFIGQPSQFDCHHLDPKEKDFKISKKWQSAINSRDRFLKELSKCILLCANCHRLEHSNL